MCGGWTQRGIKNNLIDFVIMISGEQYQKTMDTDIGNIPQIGLNGIQQSFTNCIKDKYGSGSFITDTYFGSTPNSKIIITWFIINVVRVD